MFRDLEWRRRVLHSVVSEPGRCVEKQNEEGTIFRCEAIHFDGEGLIQVFQKVSSDEGDLSIQFSMYGEVLAILSIEGKHERLFYERDMGYGKREKAEVVAQEILECLEPTITEEEVMSYHL